MTCDEQIEYFSIIERIAESLVSRIKENTKYKKVFSVKVGSTLFTFDCYPDYIYISACDLNIAYISRSSSIINLYAPYHWAKSNSGNETLSFVNSLDDELWDHETYIDSFFNDGATCTETDYFQLMLLHPELPPSYDEMLRIREVLMTKKPSLDGWNMTVDMEHAELEDVRKLEFEFQIKDKK